MFPWIKLSYKTLLVVGITLFPMYPREASVSYLSAHTIIELSQLLPFRVTLTSGQHKVYLPQPLDIHWVPKPSCHLALQGPVFTSSGQGVSVTHKVPLSSSGLCPISCTWPYPSLTNGVNRRQLKTCQAKSEGQMAVASEIAQ